MSEKKNIVEEALIQMKNLESVVSENAKGILASTMKEEISQLVKESLSEQEDEVETDVDMEMDLEPAGDEEMDMDTDNEDEIEMDMDMDMDMDSEEPIDLTGASDEEILKIFKKMSDEDGVIVTQDDEEVHITDNDEDVEYIVQLGEAEEEMEMEMDEDADLDAIMDELFADGGVESDEVEDVEMDSEDEDMEDSEEDEELVFEIEFDEEDMDEEWSEGSDMVYELEMDEEDEMEEGDESYSPEKVEEGKMTIKPKGMTGKGPKFSYKKEVKEQLPPGRKFGDDEIEEGEEMMERGGKKGDIKGTLKKDGHHGKGPKRRETAKEEGDIDYTETKEAARTYGFGSKKGRGHRKAVTPNRNHVYENAKLKEEISKLSEKNEEYRKALNIFREKLQEVAVFNSNLAYATRLFTEHSTTKKEKINILRRFDDAESMKESKNLYKQIKEELSGTTDVVTESVEKIVDKAPVSGSAQSLIESKTYENPQFLRMKDLMNKITIK